MLQFEQKLEVQKHADLSVWVQTAALTEVQKCGFTKPVAFVIM